MSWAEEQRVQTQEHPGEYTASKRGQRQGGNRGLGLRGWTRGTRSMCKVRMVAVNCH